MHKVGIQQLSSESDMEIEFESDDKRWRCRVLILQQAFLARQVWQKMESMCEVLSMGAWWLWGWGRLFRVPHGQKKCKISYI